MGFRNLGLSDALLGLLEEINYQTPTEIQRAVIPSVLMGKDILGCAQTGTGKTAAFVLPILDILGEGRARSKMPRALILEPTRELAQQVADSLEKYGKHHGLVSVLLIGGESMPAQLKSLGQDVDIIVATPGRLLDILDKGKILMHQTQIFVIDEADRMMDMGFIPDIEELVKRLPQRRQTLFFSATMPEEIRKIAQKFLTNPKEVTVTPSETTASTIQEFLIHVPALKKRDILRDLLVQEKERDVTIIFCNRKRDVDLLEKFLQRSNFPAIAIHGDLNQTQRTQALQAVKEGKIKILVASDVAARGIDVPEITHVINYDVPNNPEEYVHRIGRTGRAGRSGTAFTLCSPTEEKYLANVQKFIKKPLPEVTLQKSEKEAHRAAKEEPKAVKETPNAVKKASAEPEAKDIYKTEINKASVAGFGEHVPAFMRRP